MRQKFAFVHQRATKKNIYMDPLTRHQSAAVIVAANKYKYLTAKVCLCACNKKKKIWID